MSYRPHGYRDQELIRRAAATDIPEILSHRWMDSERTMSEDRGRSDVRAFLSPTEATVAEIWSELLERHDMGPEDDFFELGGDSLLATRVLSAIARDFGLELLYEDFIDDPSPNGLFAKVAAVAL
jgi:acyl carrier protein